MKSKLFCVVFWAGFASAAFGQSLLGLTYPFGLPVQSNSGMSLTMGGAGCAVASENNVMLLNPANLGTIDRTVLSASYSFDFTRIDGSSSHSYFYSTNPVQVSIGVPFGVVGTFGISFEQRSDRTAFYNDSMSLTYNGNDTWWLRQGLSSHGGIYAWQAGWGRSIGKYGQVGISYERFYLFDEQTMVSQLYLLDHVQSSDSRDSTTVLCSGNGVRAGIDVPVGLLRIGISGEYFLMSTAMSTAGLYANGLTTPVANTSTVDSFNLRLPPSLLVGLSYDISPEWLVAGDASFVFWRFATLGGPISKPDNATATGFSLGAQYIPAPNLLTPKYWETIRYRAGVRFTQLPARDSYEYLLSLGTGLPMGKGTGILDVAVELGRRDSKQYANYSEDFLNLVFGFNGGHKWVQSTKSTY
jgi:hypothetical protein